ncbi:hypothetical protein ACP70R_006574 [Stipagrostis hirtigluma subsp. patula]
MCSSFILYLYWRRRTRSIHGEEGEGREEHGDLLKDQPRQQSSLLVMPALQ